MQQSAYLIALGSNRRHIRYGGPAGVVRGAIRAMTDAGLMVRRVSKIHHTPALGPAGRDFANAVALVETSLLPPELLGILKKMERDFGRRSARRWGSRVLDLDIVMWSQGVWPDRRRWRLEQGLVVPHRSMADRDFVLRPATEVASNWQHPLLGHKISQLHARLRQSRH